MSHINYPGFGVLTLLCKSALVAESLMYHHYSHLNIRFKGESCDGTRGNLFLKKPCHCEERQQHGSLHMLSVQIVMPHSNQHSAFNEAVQLMKNKLE